MLLASYKIIGGLAVIHHGYARSTLDVDVLVERGGPAKLEPLLTGVRVDVLEEGAPMARPGAPEFPSPKSLAASPEDPHIVALAPLVELKLYARRLQDLADVGELLKHLDEIRYAQIQASIAPSLRPEHLRLRREALDELAMEQGE